MIRPARAIISYPKRLLEPVTHPRPLIALLTCMCTAACGTSDGTIPVVIARGDTPGQQLIDFAARADIGRFRLAKPSHDFDPATSPEVLLDGWSTPEPAGDSGAWFAWAISERSQLQLQLLDPERT